MKNAICFLVILCLAGIAAADEPRGLSATGTTALRLIEGSAVTPTLRRGSTAVDVDITGFNSWDEVDDADNETTMVDLAVLAGRPSGSPVTVTGIGWDVTLSVATPSWLSEALIGVNDQQGLFLWPGEGDDFNDPMDQTYDTGGILNLVDFGLQNSQYDTGMMLLDFFEEKDDLPNAIDATWVSGSLSFEIEVLEGDFDFNGVYECNDVDMLVDEIVAATNNLDFDLTDDGSVNLDDLDAWRVAAGAELTTGGGPIPEGDATLDGLVAEADFDAWNANKFSADQGWCGGDFNADGFVDGFDMLIWNANKFTTSAGAAVPEPAGLSLCLFAFIAMVTRIRR